jgi:hypothetical protein
VFLRCGALRTIRLTERDGVPQLGRVKARSRAAARSDWQWGVDACIIVDMSWASVSPMVLPLVGVVIGASGTLLGQYLALRVDVRREAAQRRPASRT